MTVDAPQQPQEPAGAPETPSPVEEVEPLPFIALDPAVTPPAEIEKEVEFIRRRAAPKPVQGQIKTPDMIVAELEELKYLAGLNTLVVRKADVTRKEAKRLEMRARALAVKRATGRDAETRRLQVEAMAEAQIDQAEDAQIAYGYAKSVAQLVFENKSSVQTQFRAVELTYQMAGYREK